ncbi:MAG: ATP-binding protein [Candidatus Thorarchaeota archaeon]
MNDTRKGTLFSRVDPNGDVGVGIGLTLVQRIINRHGGEVNVENRVKGNHSKGAYFVVRLPLVG